jgi:hypothetical protein
MSEQPDSKYLSRRKFAGALPGWQALALLCAEGYEESAANANATTQNMSHRKAGLQGEVRPFGETLVFTGGEVSPGIQAFRMTQLRLPAHFLPHRRAWYSASSSAPADAENTE